MADATSPVIHTLKDGPGELLYLNPSYTGGAIVFFLYDSLAGTAVDGQEIAKYGFFVADSLERKSLTYKLPFSRGLTVDILLISGANTSLEVIYR